MKVCPVIGCNNVYTSNVYLVLGDWKRIEDINTLVDVGNDPSIIDVIETMNTGIGKKKVDQVILTHCHSDHTGILPLIKAAFSPVVYAFSPFQEGVDVILKDGDILRMGDSDVEIIHTPGHSSDSICLYCRNSGDLFAGDTPVIVRSADGGYEEAFFEAMKSLCTRNIRTIYFGHGEPVTQNVHHLLHQSLRNIRESMRRG